MTFGPMTNAVVAFLEEAAIRRAKAFRARRIAKSMVTQDIVADLEHYAAELEQSALELEEQAEALARTLRASHSLPAEIEDLVNQARAPLRGSTPNSTGNE